MALTTILWTATARAGLAKLPPKVRRGLLDKANELLRATDPTTCSKPLIGPLAGFYRICYSRYRAIYLVERERSAGGETVHRIIIKFVATGQRKEGDKRDIYRLAEKLLKLGIISPNGGEIE
jgi:mRNA interferase RelE/StbE